MTWSSKQQLSLENLVCLRNDLLALYMNLQKWDSSPWDTITRLSNMTLDSIWKNIENDGLINQGND